VVVGGQGGAALGTPGDDAATVGSIEIEGGRVSALAYWSGGAAIGSGRGQTGRSLVENITITGGAVDALGEAGGAGIGSGSSSTKKAGSEVVPVTILAAPRGSGRGAGTTARRRSVGTVTIAAGNVAGFQDSRQGVPASGLGGLPERLAARAPCDFGGEFERDGERGRHRDGRGFRGRRGGGHRDGDRPSGSDVVRR
jgi:hypothetical protein